MTETIIMKIGVSIILAMMLYGFVIRNPLMAYIYTRNLKFVWIVFKAQFTMDEYTFAHRIWSHPLNKPYEKKKITKLWRNY